VVVSTHTKRVLVARYALESYSLHFCRHLDHGLAINILSLLLADTVLAFHIFPFPRFPAIIRLAVTVTFRDTSPNMGRTAFVTFRVAPRLHHIPNARPNPILEGGGGGGWGGANDLSLRNPFHREAEA